METPYSLVDKINVVNLKIWHEEEIAHDPDSTDEQIAKSKKKINILNTQRNDLIQEGDERLLRLLLGEEELKVFPQCKNYFRSKK